MENVEHLRSNTRAGWFPQRKKSDGWMGRWMDEWVGGLKAVLRNAHSNLNLVDLLRLMGA